MTYFKDILSEEQLRYHYRKLAMLFHPDRGGDIATMKKVNEEYRYYLDGFKTTPKSFNDLKPGNTVYVKDSKCIVTAVEKDRFKAKSLETNRETYFSKSTGYAILNFKFRASLVKV
ncbi:MAG: hypothetical protein JXJ22_00775 [Bacteroidales bacterium]|nr:hypothetical protein [Bacteroidales bacterium]